ncbi:MAG: histidine phosphatase family protein [Cyanobacteria bacterium P01_F01_bin.42]
MRLSSKALKLLLASSLAMGLFACGGEGNTDTASEDSTAEVQEESTELTPGEQANADFVDKVSGADLLGALKEGGHVIYIRHAKTFKDYADQADPNLDLSNCETQRKLSEEGIKQAEDIGAGFKAQEIPIDKIVTSEYCRAWQTAEIAFGRFDEKNPKLNFLPFEDYTDAQVEEMKSNVMPLLTAVPPSGTNTVLVGHDDIFESATGIYPDPMGIAYIVTPDGNGSFDIVANVLAEEWSQL